MGLEELFQAFLDLVHEKTKYKITIIYEVFR